MKAGGTGRGPAAADLFAASVIDLSAPLADRMRPRTLDEFIGQDHIVGPGRLLRRAIQRDRLSSILLSGPPGTGKTTLARVIANTTTSRFIAINAVLSGVQSIRDAVESAARDLELYDRRTILFVDEVHRWNKAQQDALLPYVENGTIILIGATTENPFFEVNKALVSRSRVFQLRPLGERELNIAAEKALGDAERGYGRWKVEFEEGALEHLVSVADGDARSLLNALELAVETSAESWPPPFGTAVRVTLAAAEESIQRRAVLYDKDGDCHYDAASALIKSVRGSDPDAALYWIARMVYAGEDPRFIFRRLLVSAAEDVGLADPAAVGIVEACASAYERIGLPEGQFHLAEAVLYLATAPKSNSALGYFDALAAVEAERAEVPDHLKDANRDADGLGHGAGYLYPHAFKDHWTAQRYLPEELKGAVFYQPGGLGYESRIRDEVSRRRDTQLAAWLSGALDPRPAGAQPSKGGADAWAGRAGSGFSGGLLKLRDEIFRLVFPARHENLLVVPADDGLVLREAVRYCQEGSVTGLCARTASLERLDFSFADLEDTQRPSIAAIDGPDSIASAARTAAGHDAFDRALVSGYFAAWGDSGSALDGLRSLAEAVKPGRVSGARFAFAERSPIPGTLPGVLADRLPADAYQSFVEADSAFYASPLAPGMTAKALGESLAAVGFELISCSELRHDFERDLGRAEIAAWLSENSAYGSAIRAALGAEAGAAIAAALSEAAAEGSIPWTSAWAIALAR